MNPTCVICDIDLADDGHWHDIFQAWCCADCCNCDQDDEA